MRILDWNSLDESGRRVALSRPRLKSRADVNQLVLQVIEEVRREGDAALRLLTQRFDHVAIETFAVTEAEFREARQTLTREQITALERAIENVERFHAAHAPGASALEVEPGVLCEQLICPISAVGLYVPAGTAPLPSAVIMLAVPARIAGCPRRILCSPAGRDGRADPAVLVAAQLCGIDTVFKVGGSQAIAAMAYGTETIPKVDKLFGPGNIWVMAAKQLVASDPFGAACDLPAGPSEVLVVADETARAEFVAADLLAQAEHDALAQAILVTESRKLAESTATSIQAQLAGLSRRSILEKSLSSSRCIVVSDLPTAIRVANEYAAEHLILEVREPRQWLPQIHNAGSIFLGDWSPEPIGDYCSG